MSGWWFGCHFLHVPMIIGNVIIPIDELIFFQRAGPTTANHQPKYNQSTMKYGGLYIYNYIYISPYPTNENRKDFWFLQPVGVWNLADSIPEIGWSSHERDFKTTGYLVVGQGHRTPNPHEVVHTYLYIYIHIYLNIYIYIYIYIHICIIN